MQLAILSECEVCLECCLRISTGHGKLFTLFLYRTGEFQCKCSLALLGILLGKLNYDCMLEFPLWLFFFLIFLFIDCPEEILMKYHRIEITSIMWSASGLEAVLSLNHASEHLVTKQMVVR